MDSTGESREHSYSPIVRWMVGVNGVNWRVRPLAQFTAGSFNIVRVISSQHSSVLRVEPCGGPTTHWGHRNSDSCILLGGTVGMIRVALYGCTVGWPPSCTSMHKIRLHASFIQATGVQKRAFLLLFGCWILVPAHWLWHRCFLLVSPKPSSSYAVAISPA